MAIKKALITGITGQDGSYLAELLLAKNYEVHGIIRRASTFNTGRIDHLYQDPHLNDVRLLLHYGDIADSTNLIKLLYRIQLDEVYHLAAQSHVRVSFDIPEYTGDVTGLAKKMMLVQAQAYRAQYGFNAIYLLPVNLYGPRDNVDLETSHVIPALIRKCVEAKENGQRQIVLWGDGSPTCEFLFVEDAAEGLLLAAEHYNGDQPVNWARVKR